MSKDKTIEQVKQEKALLEGKIETMLKEFYEETGAMIWEMNLDNIDLTSFDSESEKEIQPTVNITILL